MESSENPANTNPSAPRNKNSETNSPTTRGRKRDKNNLTTPEGGSDVRDRSKDLLIGFKKPRLTPEGGSDVRDRSKDLFIGFKKPRLTKRGLRSKKVPSRGNAPPAANVTTPTSAFTPPTLSLAPPTPSLTPPTPSLTPHIPSLAPPTPSLAPPSITVIKCRAKVFEEDDRRVNKEPCYSLMSQRERLDMELRWILLGFGRERENRVDMVFRRSLLDLHREREDREKAAKQRIVQLLLREDERSREQDSEEHLQKKKQDLISLFRDMEGSGEIRRLGPWSPSLREELDEAVKNFLYQGDKSRLREETQRFYRYQKLLEQWIEAFTREEHDVSVWVGDYLKDVLTQVYDGISRLNWVNSLQSYKSGFFVDKEKAKQRIVQLLRREDERSREQDSEEHLQKKKQDLISLFRDIEGSGEIWGWEEKFCRSQKSSSLRKKLDKAVENFLYLGDKDELREETQRLHRYQKLLEQWIEAFIREEHDVSVWVGDCLKDVLTEVHDGIFYLNRVKSLQSSKSGRQVRFLRRPLHENLGKSGALS